MILGKRKKSDGTLSDEPNTKYNVVVAAVLAILATRVEIITQIIHNAIPKVGVTIIGLLMFLIIITLFTGKETGMPTLGWLKWFLMITPMIAVAYYFLSEIYDYLPYLDVISENMATVIILAVFGVVIFAITSDGNNDNSKKNSEQMWKEFFKKN